MPLTDPRAASRPSSALPAAIKAGNSRRVCTGAAWRRGVAVARLLAVRQRQPLDASGQIVVLARNAEELSTHCLVLHVFSLLPDLCFLPPIPGYACLARRFDR